MENLKKLKEMEETYLITYEVTWMDKHLVKYVYTSDSLDALKDEMEDRLKTFKSGKNPFEPNQLVIR